MEYNELYELLTDLALDYISENYCYDNGDMELSRDKWENDEIIMSIDTLKDYLDEIM